MVWCIKNVKSVLSYLRSINSHVYNLGKESLAIITEFLHMIGVAKVESYQSLVHTLTQGILSKSLYTEFS